MELEEMLLALILKAKTQNLRNFIFLLFNWMLIIITLIASWSLPTECAFSAILQNDIPWTVGFLNFSVIFFATSLSSYKKKKNY